MTDEDQCPPDVEQHSESATTDPELRYPQLLLTASFESLLSHSHSSQPQTATAIDSSVPKMSLSESWSSLSEYDLSHDEDLQSEATDTGSLIDVSTSEDIHSVNDQGETSDTEYHSRGRYDEQDDTEHDLDSDRWEDRQQEESHHSPYGSMLDRGCIRLDDSVMSIDSQGTTVLRASRSVSNAEVRSSVPQLSSWEESQQLRGVIKMTMSAQNLELGRKPFHVLYHGPKSSPLEVKSDVLGKIGAALIASGDQQLFKEHAEPPCYHVVPSEFGPGSKSSTADLIPIPTQLHVSDCALLDNGSDALPSSSIRLQLSTGTTVTSRSSNLKDIGRKQGWISLDLCVIVVDEDASDQERFEARRVLEFCLRHHVPSICLREGASWNGDSFLTHASPDMLLKCLEFEPEDDNADEYGRNMLLDVESFLALDSEQINQHLRYLVDSAATKKFGSNTCQGRLLKQFKCMCHEFFASCLEGVFTTGPQIQNNDDNSSNWVLEMSPSSSRPYRPSISGNKLTTESISERHRSVSVLMRHTVTALLFTIITTFAVYTLKAMCSNFFGTKTLTIQGVSVERYSNCSVSNPVVAESTASTALVTTSQTYALSGPLQALEQQVQNWMPRNYGKASEPINGGKSAPTPKKCQSIATAQVPPKLKVDRKFLVNRSALWKTRVERDGEKIPMVFSLKASTTAVTLLVDEKELHGFIQIYLNIADNDVCYSLDLEKLTPEATASWINGFSKVHPKSTKQHIPLLGLRAMEPKFVQNALDLHHSATRGIGAAVEVVERLAIKQAMKYHDTGKVESRRQDLSKSALGTIERSLSLIDQAREHVSESAESVRQRANKMTGKAMDEITNAVQVVQSSIQELSLFKQTWQDHVAGTLAQAQQRAHKLVGTSGKKSKKAM